MREKQSQAFLRFPVPSLLSSVFLRNITRYILSPSLPHRFSFLGTRKIEKCTSNQIQERLTNRYKGRSSRATVPCRQIIVKRFSLQVGILSSSSFRHPPLSSSSSVILFFHHTWCLQDGSSEREYFPLRSQSNWLRKNHIGSHLLLLHANGSCDSIHNVSVEWILGCIRWLCCSSFESIHQVRRYLGSDYGQMCSTRPSDCSVSLLSQIHVLLPTEYDHRHCQPLDPHLGIDDEGED